MNKMLKIAAISVGSLAVLAVAWKEFTRIQDAQWQAEAIANNPNPKVPRVVKGDWLWTYTPVKELGTGDGQQFWLTNVTVKNPSSTAINLNIVNIAPSRHLEASPGWNSSPAGNDEMTWQSILGQHSLFGATSNVLSFPPYPDELPISVPIPPHGAISGEVVIPVPIGQSHESFMYYHVTGQVGNGYLGDDEPMGTIQLPKKGA